MYAQFSIDWRRQKKKKEGKASPLLYNECVSRDRETIQGVRDKSYCCLLSFVVYFRICLFGTAVTDLCPVTAGFNDHKSEATQPKTSVKSFTKHKITSQGKTMLVLFSRSSYYDDRLYNGSQGGAVGPGPAGGGGGGLYGRVSGLKPAHNYHNIREVSCIGVPFARIPGRMIYMLMQFEYLIFYN